MRAVLAALVLAVFFSATAQEAKAQSRSRDGIRAATPAPAEATQLRRRPRVRIYRSDDGPDVYPRYNPGPNAVRDCTATYVQEFRPSGTVITPRMSCYWRRP